MGIRSALSRALATTARALEPAASAGVQPAYDAAGNGVRIRNWSTTGGSINSILSAAGPALVSRSRDMVRKNPWARSAIESYVIEAIGTGLRPRPTHPDKGVNLHLRELWKRWVDEADAACCLNYYGQQALALTSEMEGGDCFGRFRARRPEDGLEVPFQIELLESEMVPLEKTESLRGGQIIRSGIEFDAIGRKTAFHMRHSHPGDLLAQSRFGTLTRRIPASDVMHLMKPSRPGQVRGAPWLSTVLLRLYEMDQLEDALLKRQQLAAMLTGFIQRGVDQDGNPVFQGEDDEDDDTVTIGNLQPGTFQVLNDGESVNFADLPSSGDAGPLTEHMLSSVAAGAGVTREALTGDLSKINYSSIRAGLLKMRRGLEQYQHGCFVFQWGRPTWRRFIDTSVLAGKIPLRAFRADPDAFYGVRWVPQGHRWVDPLKEVAALIAAIRAGLISRTEAAYLSGFDAEEIDQMIADETSRTDGLGLSYDSDGRRAKNAGDDANPNQEDRRGKEEDAEEEDEDEDRKRRRRA